MNVGDVLSLRRKHCLSERLQPNFLEVGEQVKILKINPPTIKESTGHRLLYTHITFSPLSGPHQNKQFVVSLSDGLF